MSNIGPFELYTKVPNDIHYGKLYTREVVMPLYYSPKRTIRVYVPEDFDPNKKYPLLVMSDGQNMVDRYTTSFGAWDIDDRMHELIQEGYPSFILLGIDSGPNFLHRALELSLPYIRMINEEEGAGLAKWVDYQFESHLFFKYIVEDLIPEVKKYFPISDNKDDIGASGASMGGIYAFSIVAEYPETFGFSMIFSPGFFLYKESDLNGYFDKVYPRLTNQKLYMYTGSKDFEAKFTKRTIDAYNYFRNKGYPESQIKLLVDKEAEHNEKAWSKHFNEAIRFWLKKKA